MSGRLDGVGGGGDDEVPEIAAAAVTKLMHFFFPYRFLVDPNACSCLYITFYCRDVLLFVQCVYSLTFYTYRLWVYVCVRAFTFGFHRSEKVFCFGFFLFFFLAKRVRLFFIRYHIITTFFPSWPRYDSRRPLLLCRRQTPSSVKAPLCSIYARI